MQQHFQLEVIANITSCMWCESDRKPGDIIWVTSREAARHLIENNLCRWPRAKERPAIGPSETPQAGPSEVKKNHSDELMAGPLIDSQSSNELGLVRLSSVSAAALVLPKRI